MGFLVASFLSTLLFCTLSAQPIEETTQPEPEVTGDIQFQIADIIAQYPLPTKTVSLEAFLVRNRTKDQDPKWVSNGYPVIVNTNHTNGSLFSFTTEYISMAVKLMDEKQQDALFQMAKHQYPDQKISMENILQLPLLQFSCSLTFFMDGQKYYFRGHAYDLHRNPLLVRFDLHQQSKKRIAFEKRIASEDDPLFFECELAASGKQEKSNSMQISIEQLQKVNLTGSLLGHANEAFVTRNQLNQAAQELRVNLHVEENYEIEREEFSHEFIEKVAVSSFHHVQIDEALALLSKYGAPIDKRDLSPQGIKIELSDIFELKMEEGKQRIVAKRPWMFHCDTSLDDSITTGFFSFLFEADPISMDNWSKNSSSLDDQLDELYECTQKAIRWEIEDDKIVPRSLNVAKVTKMALDKQMTFTRIKRRIPKADHIRKYELSTLDIVESTEQYQRYAEIVQRPLAELNQTMKVLDEKIEQQQALSIQLDEKIKEQQALAAHINQSMSVLDEKIMHQEALTIHINQSMTVLNELIQQQQQALNSHASNEYSQRQSLESSLRNAISELALAISSISSRSSQIGQLRTDIYSLSSSISSKSSDINRLDTELSQLRTSLYNRGPYVKSVSLQVECYWSSRSGSYYDMACPNGYTISAVDYSSTPGGWQQDIRKGKYNCCRQVLQHTMQEVIPGQYAYQVAG